MRKIYAVLAGVVLGLAFNINAAPMQLSAQPVQSIGGVQPAQADSFSSINLTATPVQAAPISLNADDMSSLRLLSDEQLTTFVNALDATPTIPVASLPRGGRVGTFWSLQNPTWPPLPFDSSGAAAWPMSDGGYLLNDLNFNYDAPQKGSLKSGGSMQATAMSSPPGFGAGGGAGSFTPNDLNYTAPDYGTNLWIAQAALASGYLTGIGSNTLADIQYEIQSKTNLLQTNWLSEGFILGSEITNWTPLSVAKGSRTNLFIRLRSWIDSDNVGIPDWWQLQYFGYVGINPYAASPAGDGYTIWQKYQSGLNPTNFETPPAPNNFVAVLSTNGTNVLLSWNSAQGTVTHYSIVRGVYNSGTGNYDYSTIATVSPSTTSFVNVGAIQNANDQYDLYELSAEYPGGNSSQTAYSSIYATAPPTATSPAPAYNIYVSATLVRNATGRWQLMFSGLPSNVQTIRLYWNSTTQSISASVLTNGIYRIPDTDVVNYLGDTVSVQGFGVNGEPGQIVQVGILPNDAPYFVDGRQHMKQNLNFLIRGASETEPFFASYYDEGFLEFGFGYLGLFADVTQFRFNTSSTNFEEFSFLHHGIQLDDLWPFAANSDLANYFVDTTRTNTFPFGSTNFTFTLNFATNIPAPPVLTRADPYWILQAGFNPASYRYTATNWAVSITATQTVATLASGGKNLFGLPYQAGCEVDMQYGNSGFFSVNSLYQILDTGSSVTANSGYMIGDFASWCPAPTLVLNSYYFASLINPNANPMNLPGEIDPYDGSNFQPFPLPIDDDFNVTNQTPPLIIGAVGQPMILGGWAKYAISNSSPTKYAYLGQYFVTNAFLLNTNGTVTTNIAGILSPYGEFFPTQAGRAQLITMPDIDTGKQGTNIVQIISLNVDANHDGTMDLSYFGQDQTSPGKPYVFWCNNNFDRWHKVDGTDFEQDDMPPQGAPDCNLTDDYGHRIIPCARDLEDFTRLWINGVTSNLLATLPIGSSVILSWGDVSSPNSGNPTIDLFAAADTDGGIGYLTNATVAAQQTNSSAAAYIGRLGPGDSIQLNSLMNQLPTTHFIWCGVTNGSGKLTLTFKNPSGNILGQASVYIQIVDIKQMYERWTVGDNTTQPPATTAYPAGDLPPDMTQSFQYTTLATTNTPYILSVHGWNMDVPDKDHYAETAFKRLYWQGYQGRFGEFRWPTLFNFPFEAFQMQSFNADNYDSSEFAAWKSGTGLHNLLSSLNTQYSGSVFLMAHSMGNVVAGEALRLAGATPVVNTYIAMQGAVPAHCYDAAATTRSIPYLEDDGTPNRYANYWTNGAPCYFNNVNGAGTYINFFNPGDYALDKWTTDQNLKPADTLSYSFDHSTTNFFRNSTQLYFPTNTYEIFSFCDEARCYALGAQPNVAGVFKTGVTYHQIELDTAPYNFGSVHKYHSGEYRSDYAQRWQFWNQALVQMKLK